MADELGDENWGRASSQVVGNEGVAQVVDLGAGDSGDFEIAVNGGSDVADKERPAGFGNEKGVGLDFGAHCQVGLEGSFDCLVERNVSFRMAFYGGDFDEVVTNGIGRKGGKLTDAHPGLQEKLNNSSNTGIITAGVAQGAIFHAGEDAGGFRVELGVRNGGRHIVVSIFMEHQKAVKSFNGVNFPGDGLGSVVLSVEEGQKIV